jgi:hypothetical protein
MTRDALYSILQAIRTCTPLTFKQNGFKATIMWQYIHIAEIASNRVNETLKVKLIGDNIGTRALIRFIDNQQLDVIYI